MATHRRHTGTAADEDQLLRIGQGPEIVTLSPGLREKMYDEQIPGLTFMNPPFTRSNGGVAIRMLSMMMFPSAGWLAIE